MFPRLINDTEFILFGITVQRGWNSLFEEYTSNEVVNIELEMVWTKTKHPVLNDDRC